MGSLEIRHRLGIRAGERFFEAGSGQHQHEGLLRLGCLQLAPMPLGDVRDGPVLEWLRCSSPQHSVAVSVIGECTDAPIALQRPLSAGIRLFAIERNGVYSRRPGWFAGIQAD